MWAITKDKLLAFSSNYNEALCQCGFFAHKALPHQEPLCWVPGQETVCRGRRKGAALPLSPVSLRPRGTASFLQHSQTSSCCSAHCKIPHVSPQPRTDPMC